MKSISSQAANYTGAGGGSTLLLLVPEYLGMVLIVFVSPNVRWYDWHHKMQRTAPFGFFGEIFFSLGMILAGSGLFMVIYSSLTVWSALGSRFYLGRRISPQRWAALAVIVLGLAVSVMGASGSGDDNARSGSTILLGCASTVVSTMLYACSYISCEEVMTEACTQPGERVPTPHEMCFWTGTYNLSFTLIYVFTYTWPRWETLVMQPLLAAGNTPNDAFFAYATTALLSMGQYSCYYYLIKTLGAVSVGVLQAMRSAAVFILSHVFYCSTHGDQCLTAQKGASAAIVVAGCIFYSYVSSPASSSSSSASSSSSSSAKTVATGRRDKELRDF